jgi:ABC-type glycerol-3-phosphate transport system substrate-binding protein
MPTPAAVPIELTLPVTDPAIVGFMQESLTEFTRKRLRAVEVLGSSWDAIWQELVKIALYKAGADMAGIGTTWIGSFVDMNALRPFSRIEVSRLGGEAAYFASAWQPAQLLANPQIWSIPYVLDTRVIFYWRDLLERAGVDEVEAFNTIENVNQTCRRLQASGVATPWATVIGRRSPLYYASS